SSSGCAACAAASARRSPADGGVVAACRVSARPILAVAFSSARRMWSAWMVAVSRVTWAVTNGLPSRSAPTQLPNRRKARTGVADGPVELPVHRGDHAEQGLVERGHDRADLVDRVHGLDPQR